MRRIITIISALLLIFALVLSLAACTLRASPPTTSSRRADRPETESPVVRPPETDEPAMNLLYTPVSSGQQRWEYMTLTVNTGGHRLEVQLDEANRLGAEGWELVSAFRSGYSDTDLLYFKRSLP